MILSSLDDLFKAITGRYDLVTTSSTVYNYKTVLWEATKWLSEKFDHWDSRRQYKKDIAVGDYYLDGLNYIRSIKEVTLSNADGRVRLTKKSLKWLKDIYNEPISDIDQATPLYYAPAMMGLSPQQVALTSSDYTDDFTYDTLAVRFTDDYDARGILIMPPTDSVYSVTIEGNFYPLQLSSDSDENFWSANYPEALCIACNYVLAAHQSNLKRMAEIEEVVTRYLVGSEKDVVDESMPEDPRDFCLGG